MENVGYTYYEEEKFFHAYADNIMGTRFDMLSSGLDDDVSRLLWEEVTILLKNGDEIFNRFSPESELSKVNESLRVYGSVELGPVLYEQVSNCFDYYERTLGLFDITRGYFRCLSLKGMTLSIVADSYKEINLDFGGYAKGWALKRIEGIIKKYGASSAFVDFGGSSIYAFGNHPSGNGWQVDLPSPFDGHIVASYLLSNESLSTSGNTPWYSGHIINPISGQKECSRSLATVRCKDPLQAEILSTAYMVCDTSRRERLESNFPEVKFEKFNLNGI